MTATADSLFEALSLTLAARRLGQTGARPPVGCVVARGGEVIARGATDADGRHAEEIALASLGDSDGDGAAAGAEVFTTLEPCAHEREGGGCAERLMRAGVRRVVYLTGDPDPRTDGRGAEILRRGGVEVLMSDDGERRREAYCLALGHICRVREGRPMVTLKMAASLDGRIAPPETGAGERRWITGEDARRRAHLLRSEHDVILVGSETVLADDPELTVRLRGWEGCQPLRVVLDTRLRVSPGSVVCRGGATWIFTRRGADAERRAALEASSGVRVIEVEADGNVLSLPAVLGFLKEEGYGRVLVEGGGRVASAFLASKFVDMLAWFTAPVFLGAEAAPSIVPPYESDGDDWKLLEREIHGDDLLSLFLSSRHISQL
ncbi:MAG: bifunctional diaminohydroxyphosphoribosylaminopyrimidine deaminase/5-amino-6-(5-phosphoribosylamino)uracil reductase RibD [Alphaproteobacteria bacterium]|nr:bifunctional diaminohydroxyphosphoribosylaminopyrimidine deaminase/5-amino-6-(5-phosphoribosylamino)uracil reductase RibD [Alphaproteobacteria bacterium]MDA8004564.1 bifunctional diaminohydroxyphosphoribosylaminopyrimidine deaminase/5-amino-6-(5-phosphoribosylamino)uracil reductase RibD [Alphaproteobacteria bacterium]MDA8006405.1 bifunctional diaminohydroxyphosphoribosylaminopyrimidine deaminase/5-amino-6-(5-phosphoribosylamino)uracil reductase RibD [Alphaproteobacteria bacterium]MDA8013814.1